MNNFLCKFCLINLFIIFSFGAYTQSDSNKIDSLKKVLQTNKEDTNRVNTLNALSNELSNMGVYAEAMEAADKALLLAKKLKFIIGQAKAYRRRAWADTIVENIIRYLDYSIPLAKQANDLVTLYGVYMDKGQFSRSNERYPEAMQSFLEALKIAELGKDKYNMASAYEEIANVSVILDNDAYALKNFESSLKLFTGLNSFVDEAICYLGQGQIYYSNNDYKAALFNLNQGLVIIQKAKPDDVSGLNPDNIQGFILSNIGKVLEALGTSEIYNLEKQMDYYKDAEKNYLQAKMLGEKNNNNSLLPDVFLNLGSLYIKKKKITDSKVYLDKAIQLYEERHFKDGLKESYLKLSIYDSASGNYKKAYEDYKFYMQYYKEIQSDSSVRKTTQLQNQYEFNKKETLAKAAQEKKDAEVKRIKNQQYFAIALLGIVVSAVITIALIQFRNNKRKQKVNFALLQQKEKVESTLSELKLTQGQLIQSEKMASLGELTAGIAHEIQNPLNFVNNFSEVSIELIDEMKDEISKGNYEDVNAIADNVKQNLDKINHHGKRADAIVKGMLQHSRSSTGHKEPTDLNALCDEYLRLSFHGLRARDKDFNATMQTDFDKNIGEINIISQDMGRVLLNLFTNAFYTVNEKKKTADEDYKPLVSLETKKNKDIVEIKIADNGNGIPPNAINKIFQPFFTTKPTGQGTGLGLSLSYDIIKAHDGEIRVESKAGEGSEFIIQLPIV